MRLCRFQHQEKVTVGFYHDDSVIPLTVACDAFTTATREQISLSNTNNLLEFLPPDGQSAVTAQRLSKWCDQNPLSSSVSLPIGDVHMLVPVPRPPKLFLLAGNYAAHVEEGGEYAAERAETFPYVFMKPPTTTLTNPRDSVKLPSVSPTAIDYELELAVVIGRQTNGITEADALRHVAGFTIINDISNRKFRPNPHRKERPKDRFFDWLHGKWHDSFCPCGPCVTSSDDVTDPQDLKMQLRVNGELRQDASTALQIFPVAAVIEFISSFVTLEPGDIISTGTPSGVGNTSGTYLQPGDRIEAEISSIGCLVTDFVAEESPQES